MAQTIDLCNLKWEFKRSTEAEWLRATVPGTVHTDLLANKKIADPFYRNNEKELQWIDKADWEYRTGFVANEDVLENEHVELRFEGLDTYADVYLNGKKILEAYNMHRSWKVDVKNDLKEGHNELRIFFHSPVNKVMPLYDSLGYTIPVSNNDQAEKRVSVFTRKAGYHYGWDWGPRFVTSGIWRPVTLTAWNNIRIEDLFIRQIQLDDTKAALQAQVEAMATTDGIKSIEITVDGQSTPLLKKEVLLYKGDNKLNVSFVLDNPELWWPNGMGKQKLYNFTISIKEASGEKICRRSVKAGLRKIELVQESDAQGRSFYLKVNGHPVFMKGANYIPQDNFLPSVTKERYEHILNSAVTSHMNMLRVWGGGVYQDDLFYELCDEKGILIWQDFMFACSLWPPFEDLKQNIYEEAVENVKRLRNHASIALWCGNNEVVQFFNSGFWGQVKEKWNTPQDLPALLNTYKDIFHYILPAAVKAYDEDRAYWSSSPNADNFSMSFETNRMTGDQHYWGVWGGNDKIEDYNKKVPRFMSEYGFQSFPSIETVRSFADTADLSINSAVMTGHQRSNRGNAGILEYMKDWFMIPADFTKFLYVGQLLQAEAIRTAMEAHRRSKPFCMGSLFWQIDDCWPAASWSSIDFYGRWKALQYQSKRSFAPVILSQIEMDDSIKIYLVSDSLKSIAGSLRWRLMDFNGQILKQGSRTVSADPNESKMIYAISKTDLLSSYKTSRIVLQSVFETATGRQAEHLYYFEKPKDLELSKPGITYDVYQQGGQYKFTINTKMLARFIGLSVGEEKIIFSDNYFDLVPGEQKSVWFRSGLSLDEIKKRLHVISLVDCMTEKIKEKNVPVLK